MIAKERLYHHLLSGEPLSSEDVNALKILCDKKPQFAAAQMLLLKQLQRLEDHEAQKQKKHAALVCPNRTALHDYISPIEQLNDARPSLDFQPKKSQTTDGKNDPVATKESAIMAEETKAVEKANTSESTQATDAKPLEQEPESTERISDSENDNDKKPPPPVTPSPVKKQSETKEPSEWDKRIAALKAKSAAIIEQTKHVAQDNDEASEVTADLAEKRNDTKHDQDGTLSEEITTDGEPPSTSAGLEVSNKHEVVEDISPKNEQTDSNYTSEKTKSDKAQTDSPSLSFSEWLKQVNRSKSKDANIDHSRPSRNEKWQRVDAFLEKLPNIAPPVRPTASENRSSPVAFVSNPEDDNELTTETLARLYVEQGHIDKAIRAYEILQLNNPEKSGLFARQIQSLKEKRKT